MTGNRELFFLYLLPRYFLCLLPETDTLNSVSASSLRHKIENFQNIEHHHPLQCAVSQANLTVTPLGGNNVR